MILLFSVLSVCPVRFPIPGDNLQVHKKQALNPMIQSLSKYLKWDSNPHSRNGQGILSPSCLPFHHSGDRYMSCKVMQFFSIVQIFISA